MTEAKPGSLIHDYLEERERLTQELGETSFAMARQLISENAGGSPRLLFPKLDGKIIENNFDEAGAALEAARHYWGEANKLRREIDKLRRQSLE